MALTQARSEATVLSEQTRTALSTERFKAAFRMHPAGVAVITARSGEQLAAMTISSLNSVSTEPPLVSFSVSALSYCTPIFLEAESVVIHLLGSEQLSLAQLGATGGIDRFADKSRWEFLPTGEPVFREAYAWLRARIVQRVEAGNSTICIAHVLEGFIPDDANASAGEAKPLVYHARTWHELGGQSVIG